MMCSVRRAVAALALLAAMLPTPLRAQDFIPIPPLGEPPMAPQAVVPLADVPYAVTLVGATGELEDMIQRASRLIALQDRPPGTMAALMQRVADDREIVGDALRSLGFFAGEVSVVADEGFRPVPVTITVAPGPQFSLVAFQVRSERPDLSLPPLDIPLEEIGVELGQPARTANIIAAEAELIAAFARRAYPLADIVDRTVVADHATQGVSVDILVDTGPFARFGEVQVQGLTGVTPQLVINRLPWEFGEPFDLGRLEEARRRLVGTNLFGSIRLTPADELAPDGTLPVLVELQERPHRTIGGTVSWNSNAGFGIEAYWEHRNLMSGGERLHAATFYNELGYGARSSYRDPDFWRRDWDLIADIELESAETDAYDTKTAFASLGADLRLTDHWRVRAVGAVEYSIEDADGRERSYTLLSAPLLVTRDTTDDLLDPTRGGRFELRLTPYYTVAGTADSFIRIEIGDSIYYQLFDDPRVILAGWADLGTILGGSLDGVPANRRFYAGGGGSVRAYGFQMAGPLGPNDQPTGGLSLFAFGGEARVNVTETIAVVPFIEAGTVFQERYPDFSNELLWGAGLGLRYHTGIGPVRADIAFPINRRAADDLFQVYLSFGQAF